MNILFGRRLFGRLIFSGNFSGDKQGQGNRNQVQEFYPGQYAIYAYAKDGTKTAIFGSGHENNALSQVTFEISTPSSWEYLERKRTCMEHRLYNRISRLPNKL